MVRDDGFRIGRLKKKEEERGGRIGIEELLGYCVGVVGIGLDDFERCTFEELAAINKAHREEEEKRRRDRWERMRIHACMTMQPHCSKRLKATTLLPLPWDGGKTGDRPSEPSALSVSERRERFLKRAHPSRNAEENSQ